MKKRSKPTKAEVARQQIDEVFNGNVSVEGVYLSMSFLFEVMKDLVTNGDIHPRDTMLVQFMDLVSKDLIDLRVTSENKRIHG